MEAKDIVDHEIARQSEFGMEPSFVDIAEISFKAGRLIKDEDLLKLSDNADKLFKAIKQQGIQEVVDWVIEHYDNGLFLDEWQAKVREWLGENK
jgi:hypothetical protein